MVTPVAIEDVPLEVLPFPKAVAFVPDTVLFSPIATLLVPPPTVLPKPKLILKEAPELSVVNLAISVSHERIANPALSVVPTKFVLGSVPALPVKPHPLPLPPIL